MERNPYAPPDAQVADPVREAPSMQRPRTVTLALRLMWAALAISAVNVVLGWNTMFDLAEIPAEVRAFVKVFAMLVMVLSFTAYVWIVWKMGEGRNWARIVLLIFQLLSLVANPFSQLPKQGVLVGSIGILAFVMEVAAIVLMFLPASREWFQPRPKG